MGKDGGRIDDVLKLVMLCSGGADGGRAGETVVASINLTLHDLLALHYCVASS